MSSGASPNKLFNRGSFLVLGFLLVFFVLYPLCILLVQGVGTADGRGVAAVFSSLRNSAITALWVSLWTTVIGGALAWLIVKTDFPHKQLVHTFAIGAFIIPPYIIGLAWVQFFGRNGYFDRFVQAVFSIDNFEFPYYSTTAVIVVMTLHLYPLMYLSLRNALQQQDNNLERAAQLSGASPWRIFFTVTLPLMAPSIFSTALLVFSRTMANFTVPALLALPARKEYLTTLIFSSLSALNIKTAAQLSLLLVLITTALFWIHASALRLPTRSASPASSSSASHPLKIGNSRGVVTAGVFLFLGATVVLPIAVMTVSSFLKRWGLPLQAEYFTLKNYSYLLFEDGRAWRAFRNSVSYGITAAGFAGIIGGWTAFLVHNQKTKAARILETVAGWPMAFPNIVLAVAAILAWNRGPMRLYGTPWAIIVTYMILFIPIIMKQISGLIQSHDPNLVKAARVSGAGPLQSFFSVTLPAITPGLKAGFLICFLIALREIPISLMLYSSGQQTLGVLLFGMQSEEYGLEMTSALSIIMILLIVMGNIILRKGVRKNTNEKTTNKRYLQTIWSDKGN